MRHSPKPFDEIASLFSASCPFGKLSVRQNRSVRQNVRSAKSPSAKCLSAKCPGTMSKIYTVVHVEFDKITKILPKNLTHYGTLT
jgi:hypothetical protein